MVPEDAIRLRSYEVWLREGCPEGKALEHWFKAEAELRAEFHAQIFGSNELRYFVMERPPISRPPRRVVSNRVQPRRRPNAA